MKIEHLALYVEDLERMKDFYVKYFQAKAGDLYHNKTTGLKTYFLYFEDGARLEIMNKPGLKRNNLNEGFGYTHLAFSAGSKEAVNILTQQLKEDGFKIISGPRTTGDGYYESLAADPENNLIEITQ
ncbi:MAG: VOC family protein [Elusimicrobiaceae bacterium]|nr:VOC family protein [Elusimicrobiota bacterium]